MPMPKPRKGEKQEAFVSRCHSALNDEFPDQAQRHAVCMRQWRQRHRRKSEFSLDDAHAAAFLNDDPYCLASYLGPWAIKPDWFEDAISKLKMGIVTPTPTSFLEYDALDGQDDDDDEASKPYFMTDGVAIIRLIGQMQKGYSKFGGTSTVLTKRAVRLARRDPAVKAILLAIDSPGGMVAGTAELAQEVAQANLTTPVHAYIEDLGASAAYWVASQARKISANATAEIGSIGVLAILQDSSGLAERSGLTVHVVSTGRYKGMGAPGSKVLPEHLAEVEAMVEDLGSHFFQAVQEGRAMNASQLARVSDGRVWIAAKARQLGLIDTVQSFDAALAALVQTRPRSRTSASYDEALARIPRIPQGG